MKVGKKLTLSSPYHSLNNTLWQAKTVNKEQDCENTRLRTKLYHMANHKQQQSSPNYGQEQLEQRYRVLTQKHKQQARWIKDTIAEIEQRHHQSLVDNVKKVQNRVYETTQKTLKLEKQIQKNYLKSKEKQNQTIKPVPEEEVDPVQQLEQDQEKLLSLFEQKKRQASQLSRRNKNLNQQIMQLLNIKNALRGHARKGNSSSKCSVLKTTV